jgi:hypothetical protein
MISKDDMGWHRMPLDSVHIKNTPFWILNPQGWHRMTQDDTRHISCWKTCYFALILHRNDTGWDGMTAGCLPHLNHVFCIEIASKSIWDDTGRHWSMCPAKNMKFRVWFPKDDMGWHRMTLDSLHCKNTLFLWQQAVCHTLSMHFAKKLPPSQYGMTQDDTGPCALQKHES